MNPRRGPVGAAGLIPRLLLLVSVALGLVLMHTLGHAGHASHPSTSGSAAHAVHMGAAAGHSLAVSPAAASSLTAVDGHDPGLTDPMTICLAVLLTAAVLAIPQLIAVISAAGSAHSHRALPRGLLPGAREPPLLGLCLTRTTVLRI
jgi:hypothetical protein